MEATFKMRQFHEGAVIQVDHAELRLGGRIGEGSRHPKAGIVDQHVDAESCRFDRLRQAGSASPLGQIGGKYTGLYTVGGRQPSGDIAQRRFAACGEDQVVTILRKALREIYADPH